jgi:hypothetical protein
VDTLHLLARSTGGGGWWVCLFICKLRVGVWCGAASPLRLVTLRFVAASGCAPSPLAARCPPALPLAVGSAAPPAAAPTATHDPPPPHPSAPAPASATSALSASSMARGMRR